MPIKVMTLGDLRRRTADLPDDTALVIEVEHCQEFAEVGEYLRYFPASLDAPPALIFGAGQEITEDHHLVPRLDVWLEFDQERLKP